jgi:thiol:disulfide interchange protein DsbA
VTTIRAITVLATLLAGSWTLNACARTNDSAAAAASLAKWQAGTNYHLLTAPQPTNAQAGKVQVAEVFWYGCSHCYALDPALEQWNAGKPAYIEFIRIPVIWGAAHRQHAKLYYTVQALHRPELHIKVFDAIHREGLPLAARDEVEARAMHRAFFASQGISEQDFNAAYDSMSVAANVMRAETLTNRYGIGSVPTMVVAGKYSTNATEAGGTPQLLSLINDLAASERKR